MKHLLSCSIIEAKKQDGEFGRVLPAKAIWIRHGRCDAAAAAATGLGISMGIRKTASSREATPCDRQAIRPYGPALGAGRPVDRSTALAKRHMGAESSYPSAYS